MSHQLSSRKLPCVLLCQSSSMCPLHSPGGACFGLPSCVIADATIYETLQMGIIKRVAQEGMMGGRPPMGGAWGMVPALPPVRAASSLRCSRCPSHSTSLAVTVLCPNLPTADRDELHK
jgi:hypothetical protein